MTPLYIAHRKSTGSRLMAALALCFVFLMTAAPAQAHPHIFLRYSVTLTPADAGFIKLHFTFKAHAAANPLRIPDTSMGDKPLLTQDTLANLQDHPFFLYLTMEGGDEAQQKVELAPEESPDNEPRYGYDLTLPDTLENFSVSLYDPTYFDFVTLDGAEAVTIPPLSCSVQNREVGKTVWGILYAARIECEKTTGRRSQAPPSKKGIKDKSGGLDMFPQTEQKKLRNQDVLP